MLCFGIEVVQVVDVLITVRDKCLCICTYLRLQPNIIAHMACQDGVPMCMRAEPQSIEPQCTVYGEWTAMPTSEWSLCACKAVDDREPWRLRGASDD
jgi:hypothetical protein